MSDTHEVNQSGKEIEKRFRPASLDQLPADFRCSPSVFIKQCYLEDPEKTRLRSEKNRRTNEIKYLSTRKTGEGVERDEDEKVVTTEIFHIGWKSTKVRLEKIRYYYDCGTFIAQINLFQEDLTGYIQIEVEFKTREEADAFIPPAWFGPEVTDDKKHDNYSLAKSVEALFG